MEDLAATAPAVIHYCFRSKRRLFDAVFARRADILNVERMASLAAYEEAHGSAVTVEAQWPPSCGPSWRCLPRAIQVGAPTLPSWPRWRRSPNGVAR